MEKRTRKSEKRKKPSKNWSDDELKELNETGKAKGYEGHHMKSAKEYPDYVDDPDNIEFLRGRNHDPGPSEHLNAHGGDYRNPTNGYYDPDTNTTKYFGDNSPNKP